MCQMTPRKLVIFIKLVKIGFHQLRSDPDDIIPSRVRYFVTMYL